MSADKPTIESLHDAIGSVVNKLVEREGHKPNPKILRETIRVIRKQLRSHGVEIKTVFRKGYTMPRESKAKLRKLVAPRGSASAL